MEKHEAEAHLLRQSEWLVEQDISNFIEATSQKLEHEQECVRAMLDLHKTWEGSGLKTDIQATTEKLGHTYTQSKLIDPAYHRGAYGYESYGTKLPLRLGARVREVIVYNQEHAGLQAMRGNLLMHRMLGPEGKFILEAGFFACIYKRFNDPQTYFAYGNIDLPAPEATALSSEEIVGCEVLLGGSGDGLGFEDSAATTLQDLPEQQNPQKLLQEKIDFAKQIFLDQQKDGNSEQFSSWQEVFLLKNKYFVEPSEYKTGLELLLADGLGTTTTKRRFRRDIVNHGFLRQNEQAYIEPASARLAMAQKLGEFFGRVYNPIQTSSVQIEQVRQTLDHATELERIGSAEVTELDVARSVVKRRVKDKTEPVGYTLPKGEAREALRRAYQTPTYEDFPETKALLDKHFPTNTGIFGSKNSFDSSLMLFSRRNAARGSGVEDTLLMDIVHDKNGQPRKPTLSRDLSGLEHIAPSPKAFPFD